MGRELLSLIGGLAYVLFGFAIFVKRQQTGRNLLSDGLKWLGCFGILQGVTEWANMVCWMDDIYLFKAISVVSNVFSYYCLLKFALSTIKRPSKITKHFKHLHVVLIFCWIIIGLSYPFITFKFFFHERDWLLFMDIVGRYLMGVPAALFAIMGLVHSRNYIESLGERALTLSLKGMGLCLGLFAFFGGIIVPKGPIWPSTVLNEELMEKIFLIPVPAYRTVLAVIMIVLILKLLDFYAISAQRQLIEAREEFLLTMERERIGRDLHDGVIQILYGLGMQLRALQNKDLEEPVKQELQGMMQGINRAITEMRYYINGLPATDEAIDFLTRLKALVADLSSNMYNTEYRVVTEHEQIMMSQSLSDQVYLFVHEALSNVAKHAKASKCDILLNVSDNSLTITIKDDGVGFITKNRAGAGLGLGNMRRRILSMNGVYAIKSVPEHGTEITVTIPLGKGEGHRT